MDACLGYSFESPGFPEGPSDNSRPEDPHCLEKQVSRGTQLVPGVDGMEAGGFFHGHSAQTIVG